MHESFAPYSSRLMSFLFCFLVSLFVEVSAQQNDFDKRYDEVYVHIIASNSQEALHSADSLLSASKNDEQRVRSYMLLGSVHHSLGNHAEEMSAVLQAQKVARAASNLSWMARTSGFLATSFRNFGLMQESKKYLAMAEEANEKQPNAPDYPLTKINIEHEKALHAIDEKAYEDALEYLEKAKNHIHYEENETARSLIIKATNDQLQGVCYLNLGKLDLADTLLRSSLTKIDSEETNLKPYIYRAQAEVAMSRGEQDSALMYLDLVEPYLASSDREELKMLYYRSKVRFHKMFGTPADVLRYQDMYTAIKEEKERSAKRVTDEMLSKLHEENQKYEDNMFFSGLIFLVLVSVLSILLLFLVRRRKNDKQQYQQLMYHVNSDRTNVTALMAFHTDRQEDNKDVMISKETEESLLKKLHELEEDTFFLDKNMSLTKMAASFATNQRYVSYIIRKYRGKDFNDYLHHVRIHYLINRIQSDPNLLDYKLSYLADMAGFSSHSKFSSVFKSVTGLPPSVFIHFTKEEIEKGA